MTDGTRPDLSAPRPWRARPSRRSAFSGWEVVAPSRYAGGAEQLVAGYLSEDDSRAIAIAPQAADLLQRIGEGASLSEIQRTARALMAQYEEKAMHCALCGGGLPESESVAWCGESAHAECVTAHESQ